MPAYDELLNLRELLPLVASTLREREDLVCEILVVLPSTASSREADEIQELGARAVIRHPTDSFGDALRSGFAAVSSSSRFVITMDADGSHHPSSLLRMLGAASSAHVVVGSRYTRGGSTDNSFVLTAMSRALNVAYGLVLGIKCRDVSTNYKLYRRADLARITLECRDFDVVEEILFRIKSVHGRAFRITEVPDHFLERRHGTTKRQLGPFIVSYLITLNRLRRQGRRHSG
jgi:dolichol-phosphate mannosyltransferase